jgi:Flp pilus assembly protein TadD
VALDSTFAAAYAAMPFMYLVGTIRASNVAQLRDLQQRAESVARKALALDPELPEAHVGLSVALVMGYKDLPGAEAALRRALALGGTPRIRDTSHEC